MAISIKCGNCERQVSVDDGFAGGLCRCPYCRALVDVPAASMQVASERPHSPSGRPDSPGSATKKAATPGRTGANTRKKRGLLIALIVVIVLGVVIGGIVLALQMNKGSANKAPTSRPQSLNPSRTTVTPGPVAGPGRTHRDGRKPVAAMTNPQERVLT